MSAASPDGDQHLSGEPLDTRARWAVLYLGSANFLTAIGTLGLVSIMPAVGRRLEIPDYLVAGIFSFSALVWAVSSALWIGPVARHGQNLFIRLGMLGFAASMGGCALAVEMGIMGWTGPIATFLLFLVLRSIYGISGSAAAVAAQAYVAARTKGQARTRALTGLIGAISLGTIVGPALAPYLTFQPFGPVGPMVVFAGVGLFAFAASFVFLPPPPAISPASSQAPATASIRAIWRKPLVGRYLTFGLVLSSAQAMNLYTIGFVLIDRLRGDLAAAQPLIGFAMTAGALAALAAQWGLIRLVPMSAQRMMQLGAGMALAGNALAIVVAQPMGAASGFVLASFGFGLARPGYGAAASLAATGDEQVVVASAVSLIAGASIAFPPIIVSLAYTVMPSAPFAIPAALLAVLLLGNVGGHRRASIVHRQR